MSTRAKKLGSVPPEKRLRGITDARGVREQPKANRTPLALIHEGPAESENQAQEHGPTRKWGNDGAQCASTAHRHGHDESHLDGKKDPTEQPEGGRRRVAIHRVRAET